MTLFADSEYAQFAADLDWLNAARHTPNPAEREQHLLDWHRLHGGRCYADTPCRGCDANSASACEYVEFVRELAAAARTAVAA